MDQLKSELYWSTVNELFWVLGPWLVGALIAALTPNQAGLPYPIDCISSLIGWIYFNCWSFSFYPQVVSNWRRKSVVGLSLDFQLLNLLGFVCYSIYTCTLFFNGDIRDEYANQHDGHYPSVHLNDVFFAVHAAVLTLVTLFQCFIYERKDQKFAWSTILSVTGLTIAATVWAIVIAVAPCVRCEEEGGSRVVNWLSWLYVISMIKLGITLVKYIPQVILNYKRKSTYGWNIWNVLLDFEGGVLSLGQVMLDALAMKDFSAITGNPIKFGLGFTSMFFDTIFMTQHFWLYPDGEAGVVHVREYCFHGEEACRLAAEHEQPQSERGIDVVLEGGSNSNAVVVVAHDATELEIAEQGESSSSRFDLASREEQIEREQQRLLGGRGKNIK